jgi:hypothetical protein
MDMGIPFWIPICGLLKLLILGNTSIKERKVELRNFPGNI